MTVFSDFTNDVLGQIKKLAETTFPALLSEMKTDTQAFLNAQAHDLKTWTEELASGEIDKEDFNFLIHGQAALFDMHALTVAGISAARLQQFRDALIKIVVDTAFKHFLP